MPHKTVKREAVVHITPNGKVVSVKSDLHFDFPRGGFGGHIDNEPMQKPVMRQMKEE